MAGKPEPVRRYGHTPYHIMATKPTNAAKPAKKTVSKRTIALGHESTAPVPKAETKPGQQEAESQKRIHLIALCGMSPAVVFETVWALVKQRKLVPQSVVIVTTTGAERPIRAILDTKWDGFLDRLGVPRIRYVIRVPGEAENHPLEDLRTAADCATYEKMLMTLFDRSVADSPAANVDMVLSVAGGRKSMGVSAATLFALAARQGDRMVHVLVNDPYDNPKLTPPFLYPESGDIHVDPDGTKHPAKAARVELTEIPFVPLGDLVGGKKAAGSLKERVDALRGRVALRAADKVLSLEIEEDKVVARVGKMDPRYVPFKPLMVLLDLLDRHGKEFGDQKQAVRRLDSAAVQLLQAGKKQAQTVNLPIKYAVDAGKITEGVDYFGDPDTYRTELNRLREILGEGLLVPGEGGIRLDEKPKIAPAIKKLMARLFNTK